MRVGPAPPASRRGGGQLLTQDWPNPETNGPRPVIWSPAASGWAAIVNEEVGRTLAPAGRPFMQTPLVIAMPQPMAEALGYPETPIGFTDIAALANDPEGWAKYGHPEWGQFKLGKTNPNFRPAASTSPSPSTTHTGKTSGLTVAWPDVADFARSVEQAVVHYGDITGTFLSNWFRADAVGRRSPTRRRWPSRRSRSSTTTPATPMASSPPVRRPDRPRFRWSPSIRRRARSTRTTRSWCSTRSG